MPTLTLIVRVYGTSRHRYEIEFDGQVEVDRSQTRVADFIREASRACREAGVELEIDAQGFDPELIAAWRAPIKPPAR